MAPDLLSSPEHFRDPPAKFRPKAYWWWPRGKVVEAAQIRKDIETITGAGFGGARIWGLGPAADFSTPQWRHYYEVALEAGRNHGIRIDFQDAPWASPAVSGAKKELSAQELTYGKVELRGPMTYEGSVPPPPGVPDHNTLVSARAFKVVGVGGDGSIPVELDSTVTADLTSMVDNGQLCWDVPTGDWVLFGFWQRPTGQQVPATGVTFMQPATAHHETPIPDNATLVVDHFNQQATQAALRHLDEVFEGIPAELLEAAGGQISEDSLEFKAQLLWTGNFLREFQQRRGYSLEPSLPVLFIKSQHDQFQRLGFDHPPDFELSNGMGERARHDYNLTLTDLYIEEYLEPISRWAEQRGLEHGGQVAYNLTVDTTRSSNAVPVPETETLIAADPLPLPRGDETPADLARQARHALDFYRVTASGAHLSGSPEVSLEFGSYVGGNYVFNPIDYKHIIDRAYAGGVTKAVLHGHPYDKPDAVWPGWDFFGMAPTLSNEPWNSRFPQWHDWPALNAYMTRAAEILQHGKAQMDLAVYRDAPTGGMLTPMDHIYRSTPSNMTAMLPALGLVLPRGGQAALPVEGPIFDAEALDDAGYTRDFVDPVTLATKATFTEGEGLFPDGPRYQALIVDQQDAMPAATAERIVAMARDGLPVVFVGTPPGRGTSGKDPTVEDAEVRRAIAATLELPNVRQVATTNEVHDALRQLSVAPDVSYATPVPVRPVHRQTAESGYWFLWNDSDEPAQTVASFRTAGQPVLLDLWDGTITPIAHYQRDGDRVDIPLTFRSKESRVIAFRVDPLLDRRHVVATDASGAAFDDDRIVIRDTRSGVRSVELSDGTKSSVDIPLLPTPIQIEQWRLQVDEATPTGTVPHDVDLTGLADWRTIDGLREASGTGTYIAQVSIPEDWIANPRGVYLDLGDVEGSLKAIVNAEVVTTQSVPGGRWPIGKLLQPGANEIKVVVNTTLLNCVVALGKSGDPQYSKHAERQTKPYGLLGPVVLIPYAEVPCPPVLS